MYLFNHLKHYTVTRNSYYYYYNTITSRYPVLTALCFFSCCVILAQLLIVSYWQSLLAQEGSGVGGGENGELSKLLQKYAINREILIALSSIDLVQGKLIN